MRDYPWHNPLPLCLVSPPCPEQRVNPYQAPSAFLDQSWTWFLSWLTKQQPWAHRFVSQYGHDAQQGIAPEGPDPPGQRGTQLPAHLVLLQLSQDVGRHSIPDSHHLWKAKERGVRLRASWIAASGTRHVEVSTKSPDKHRPGCWAGLCPSFPVPALLCPRAGLGPEWGGGKGSGPEQWPSNPQKGMAPQNPGRDPAAWWHKRIL